MQSSQKTLILFSVTLIIVMAEFALSAFAFLLPTLKSTLLVSDVWLEHCFSYSVLSLGLAGLVYGFLTDTIGRKPLFVIALSILFASSFMAYFLKSPSWFMIARIAQSIGAGAAWVVGNACLGDLYKGDEFSKVMNKVHAIAGLIPALSPVVVTLFLKYYALGDLYYVMALISLMLLVLISTKMHETHTDQQCHDSYLQRFKLLCSHPDFVNYTWVKAISVGMMFTIMAQFPLICVEHYHIAPDRLWEAMVPLFTAYIGASVLSARVAGRVDASYIMMFGLLLLALGGISLLLGENSCSFNPIILVVSSLFFGFGCLFGNATAKIVGAVPKCSGLASALMIAAEMILSSLFIYIMAFFMDESFFSIAIFFVVTTFFASIPFLFSWTTRHYQIS